MRIVDYPTAKKLQELGYDGERRYYWATLEGDEEDGANLHLLYQDDIFAPVKKIVGAPRLDDAAYFLRERYGVVITLLPVENEDENLGWQSLITVHERDGMHRCAVELQPPSPTVYHNYEDALQYVIREVLNLLP